MKTKRENKKKIIDDVDEMKIISHEDFEKEIKHSFHGPHFVSKESENES